MKNNLLLKSAFVVLSLLSVQQVIPAVALRVAGGVKAACGMNGVSLGLLAVARDAGKYVKMYPGAKIAQARGAIDKAVTVKFDFAKFQYKNFQDMKNRELNNSKYRLQGLIPGLMFGGMCGGYAMHRRNNNPDRLAREQAAYEKEMQKYYAEVLQKDIQGAVQQADLYKLAFLYDSKNDEAVLHAAMGFAIVEANPERSAKIIGFLLDKKDPGDLNSDYRITDPDMRMLGAVKINNMNIVRSLLQQGYPLERAKDCARKVDNKFMLASFMSMDKDAENAMARADLDSKGIWDIVRFAGREVRNRIFGAPQVQEEQAQPA